MSKKVALIKGNYMNPVESALSHSDENSNSDRIRPVESIDITDVPVPAEDVEFHVNDRVERLLGDSERTQCGTITDSVTDGAGDEWLVVDNDGITHRDRTAALSPAIRGRRRNNTPPSHGANPWPT